MSSEFYRAQVMECPSCGANVAVPETDSFQCDYCGKLIMVPAELRPQPAEQETPAALDEAIITHGSRKYKVYSTKPMTEDQKRRQNRLIVYIVAGILIFSLCSLIPFFITTGVAVSNSLKKTSILQVVTTPLPTMVQFARLEMIFGSLGDQPGQFGDARSIAVDDQGMIFVADYTSGRINKFDPQGNFLQLIQVESTRGDQDVFIYGIAADALGNIFVAADGSILKYRAASGELLQTFPDQWPDIYFNSVVVAPDGNLYSTNGMAAADDVIILDPQGEILAHWVDLVENVNHDDPALDLAISVDQTAKVYLLSPFGSQVYVYNPDGTFSFSFGEEGDRAGQFSLSTGMLTFTQQDDLVISDVYRNDLYDQDGNYLGKSFTIDYQDAEGSIYGMTIDKLNDLYFISSGGKVLKYQMNYP